MATTKIVTTTRGVVTEHEIETKGFTVFVHQQGIKIDVPTFVEIDPRKTIKCMEEMSQKAWEWVSTGPLFKSLWSQCFKYVGEGKVPGIDPDEDPNEEVFPLPDKIEDLIKEDLGIIHLAGMIVLCCEAAFAKKNIFVRNPETYLHPKQERMIVTMLKNLLLYTGQQGDVAAVAEAPELEKQEPIFKEKFKLAFDVTDDDWAITIDWLNHMEPTKPFAQVGDKKYTVAELTIECVNKTPIGKMIVEKFVELRDN